MAKILVLTKGWTSWANSDAILVD